MATAAVIVLGAVYIAFTLPPVYQSSALILIESQNIPPDFVPSTVNSYLDERLQSIHQRVIAAPNVLEMIEAFDLYPEERVTLEEGDLIALFQGSTALEPHYITTVHPRTGREVTINYAFRVSFSYSEPVKARDVTQELARRYVEHNETLRGETAARTASFLDAEASQIRMRLSEIADGIAAFKELHPNNLPEDQPVNLRTWEITRQELTAVENQLRDARERKALLETDLAETPRYRPVMGESGEAVLGGLDRLAEAQQELLRLRGRYSDNHPQIISLRREIEALSALPNNQATLAQQLRTSLQARRLELAAARQNYSENHPDVLRLQRTVSALEEQLSELESELATRTDGSLQANNPAYLQLLTRLSTTNQEIEDLTRREARLSTQLNEVEQRRLAAPQVEREYRTLLNEQDVLNTRYRELRSLESQAALAQNLESGDSGERLTVLEQPRVPSSPVSPNRVSLSFLGVVLAFAFGLGVASLTDAADTTVRGQRDVYDLLDMPPIGIIPYVESTVDTTRRVAINIAMSVCFIGAAAYVIAVALW